MMGGYVYHVLLDPSEEGDGYTVTVPALPGCITQGATKEQALARVREAIAIHIKGLLDDGEKWPEEREQPELAIVSIEASDVK